MTKLQLRRAVAILLFCTVSVITSAAQTFTSLGNFHWRNGADPISVSLAQGVDGSFYGTTSQGGANRTGTVFRLRADAIETVYSFCDQVDCNGGSGPQSGIILGTDGNMYGTTTIGGSYGYGVVFKISQNGTLATLHNFVPTEASDPNAPLAEGVDGDFYGTSITGGINGYGSIFTVTPAGQLTVLYSFCAQANCADGSYPRSGLALGPDGNFYGLTTSGGANTYYGTVFKITPQGSLTTLHSFDNSDGDYPIGTLVLGSDGNFYGVTADGGENQDGTVFKMTTAGQLMTLHNFAGGDGVQPYAGLIQATDGRFYGTTAGGGDLGCHTPYGEGCGTVFAMTSDGVVTTLHAFEFTDGYAPNGALLQGTNGLVYGVTGGGGVSSNWPSGGYGTVFSLDMGLRPFVTFVRAAGKVGQTGGILGQGFTGTSAISLNGVPMDFKVISDTFIKATVPAGATTGYVTVTTPSGILTSNVPFHVIP